MSDIFLQEYALSTFRMVINDLFIVVHLVYDAAFPEHMDAQIY